MRADPGRRQGRRASGPARQVIEPIWVPNPGSQEAFLRCPIYEVLLEGTRGGGKTDVLLMDFAQFVGKGFGRAWRGMLFRRSYPELEEVREKAFKWFPMMFPKARWNGGSQTWRFATGEKLMFRYADREADYMKYHGHEYPWLAMEELTNWPDDRVYLAMMSICRSSTPGVPKHFRATCNPYGVGHNWVKDRFHLPIPGRRTRGPIIVDREGNMRMAIHSQLSECPQLDLNDPEYKKRLMLLDGPKRQAWLFGNWNIVAGGMFDDVWDPARHVVAYFKVPPTWYVNRSFDWGSSRPYSVGWWAESDGSNIKLADGTLQPTRRGDLYRICELYGWGGKPNEGTKELAVEVARKILATECRMGLAVRRGPADPSIFKTENGHSIANDMAQTGVMWERGDNSSRVNGWEILRTLMKNTLTGDGPGLYVFESCRHFQRTVPVLPRDGANMDDVDTDTEDHVADESRYRAMSFKHLSQWSQH